MKQNWLTQKARYNGTVSVIMISILVLIASLTAWLPELRSGNLLVANPELVFQQHHYELLWTTLFVHADLGHILGNMILFVPLLYLLSAYFGSWLWPLLSIFVGGLINAIVLKTLPSSVFLMGISGVANWLGATWLCLYFLIDLRESKRHRFAVALFITFMLFVPDTYKPETSYLSHLLGYFFELITGLAYFAIYKKRFKSVEIYEEVVEPGQIIENADFTP